MFYFIIIKIYYNFVHNFRNIITKLINIIIDILIAKPFANSKYYKYLKN